MTHGMWNQRMICMGWQDGLGACAAQRRRMLDRQPGCITPVKKRHKMFSTRRKSQTRAVRLGPLPRVPTCASFLCLCCYGEWLAAGALTLAGIVFAETSAEGLIWLSFVRYLKGTGCMWVDKSGRENVRVWSLKNCDRSTWTASGQAA